MISRVRVLLAERRMTMQGLADAAGVHRDTVGRWCTDDGIGGMRMKDAESVAAALGCRVSDLYGETGEAPSGR
ncbi:helix-turn-helix domain-containing protein [Paratractidigestivibacter faecalis]|uniref:helix-turn-helix domain-containing protein n=1 Tax=Paratractidigestivibacter faecalis TaxID=2292441 RepID=UPI003AB87646